MTKTTIFGMEMDDADFGFSELRSQIQKAQESYDDARKKYKNAEKDIEAWRIVLGSFTEYSGNESQRAIFLRDKLNKGLILAESVDATKDNCKMELRELKERIKDVQVEMSGLSSRLDQLQKDKSKLEDERRQLQQGYTFVL